VPVIPILFALWLISRRMHRAVRAAVRQPETRGLVYATLGIIALGTIFYSVVEGWRVIDAFYFTVVTLTTVGYGDLSPQTDAGKLFTIAYILVGLGILGGFVALIADQSQLETKQEP
jgi:voltage-gated potassium channel Kch